MSEPFKVEGVDYTPDGIDFLRRDVIKMRDEALRQGAWGPTTVLSHVIALLAYLEELVRAVAVRRDGIMREITVENPVLPPAEDWRRVGTLTESPCLRRDVPVDDQRICAHCGWIAGRHPYWPGQRARPA